MKNNFNALSKISKLFPSIFSNPRELQPTTCVKPTFLIFMEYLSTAGTAARLFELIKIVDKNLSIITISNNAKMTNKVSSFDGFSISEETSSGIKIFKCDVCSFSNTDTGGMKRHIARMHRGAKRNHETRTEDSLDQQDDKRPKVDENFGPALSSTRKNLTNLMLF
jgi:hypothetical protein